jgi:peptidyl-prolyl cis-trans isomerase SurA
MPPDMKKVVLIGSLLLSSLRFFGQTLVRYGDQTISREEFIRAFRKNNMNVKTTEKAYRDYLNLYIRYRLKVQEALYEKLDTLAGQKTDLQNFKSQIADQYINDESSLNRMAEEAFIRSQRDLRISYIFVSAPKNASPADTARAWKKIQDAYRALQENKDFGETAVLYSEDPFAKTNKGDIGFITVFDLPYAMENIAYGLGQKKGRILNPQPALSPVFRIDGGYIILKKTAERPALGRIHAAQILVAFPYQATSAAKEETRRRADSIYQAILSGSDFGTLAKKFSGDNLSFQLGGILPEFGIGKYEAGFEETAFGLKKDGEVSRPYASSFGYHIIKRIARKPVPSKADQKILQELKEKIKMDPRVAVSKKLMLLAIIRQTRFQQDIPGGQNLWDYTDSMLDSKKPSVYAGINQESVLFEVAGKKYRVSDWIAYRRSLKAAPNLTNGKKNEDLLDMYRQTVAFQYYKDHLELYNKDYAAQVNDFRDGNLLFEIMQRQIWNPASADSAALRKYFEDHIAKYRWLPGADAIIFNAPNLGVANKLTSSLKIDITNWRKEVEAPGSSVQADSGRFDWKQIPGQDQAVVPGRFTRFTSTFSPNHTVSGVRFAYIIRKYSSPSPRTFEEARGLVISDYQNELEKKWLDRLRKKYPVVIEESVFKSLPNNR